MYGRERESWNLKAFKAKEDEGVIEASVLSRARSLFLFHLSLRLLGVALLARRVGGEMPVVRDTSKGRWRDVICLFANNRIEKYVW